MFLSNFNSSDPTRPSFFEMIAQEEMVPTLKPALKYILSIVVQRRPSLLRFFQYSDEIFLFLLLLIENHHLKYYDASFAENFYGLKRVRVNEVKTVLGDAVQSVIQKVPQANSIFQYKSSPIKSESSLVRYRLLFFLLIVPYLKSKLDELYIEMFPLNRLSVLSLFQHTEQHQRSHSQSSQQSENDLWIRLKTILRTIFEKGYPYFNAVYEGLFFLYQLGYLYDYTIYYTPLHFLQKIALKRLSLEEMQLQDSQKAKRREAQFQKLTGPFGTILKLFLHIYNGFLDYSTLILPTSIFLFKFLEWWYQENPLGIQQTILIPPPDPPKIHPNGIKPSVDKKMCPLCNHTFTNPAIVPSGYMFCFNCLYNFVKEHQKCPITFLPCDITQIRKIYEST